MPTTTNRPKRQVRKTSVAAGAKRRRERGKNLDTIAKPPEDRVTVPQIAAGTSRQSLQSKALKLRARIAKLEEELKALKVADAPKVILPELHDGKSGRIDAQKMADFMGVALKPLS